MHRPTTTEELRSLDAAHDLHPFTNTRVLNERGVRVIKSAAGVYPYDFDGNRMKRTIDQTHTRRWGFDPDSPRQFFRRDPRIFEMSGDPRRHPNRRRQSAEGAPAECATDQ
jgi:hypothetical protein